MCSVYLDQHSLGPNLLNWAEIYTQTYNYFYTDWTALWLCAALLCWHCRITFIFVCIHIYSHFTNICDHKRNKVFSLVWQIYFYSSAISCGRQVTPRKLCVSSKPFWTSLSSSQTVWKTFPLDNRYGTHKHIKTLLQKLCPLILSLCTNTMQLQMNVFGILFHSVSLWLIVFECV